MALEAPQSEVFFRDTLFSSEKKNLNFAKIWRKFWRENRKVPRVLRLVNFSLPVTLNINHRFQADTW